MTQGADPAKVASHVYKLIMENDRVRVFDVTFKPGDKAVMHGHPDHVVYVMEGGTNRLTFPGGKSAEFELKPGQALWIDAGEHETVNVGTSNVHLLVFELKS
ncbi:MAG TPA: cupin domain-containing protein [bacterium]|jgi:quercetin dioxygenase-like cupin family protein